MQQGSISVDAIVWTRQMQGDSLLLLYPNSLSYEIILTICWLSSCENAEGEAAS